MNTTKRFTIFAGVNGAGKSTLYNTEKDDNLGIRLKSDEILHDLGLDWKNANAQIIAGKTLLQRQKECFDNGESFNQETTLSGKSIIKAIQQAKELGYEIHLRYVGVSSPEIAKARVANRIVHGGHGVDGDTIERRFISSKNNFLAVVPLCDSVIVYDNTEAMKINAYILNGSVEFTPAPRRLGYCAFKTIFEINRHSANIRRVFIFRTNRE